jgi:hypothetical protein
MEQEKNDVSQRLDFPLWGATEFMMEAISTR